MSSKGRSAGSPLVLPVRGVREVGPGEAEVAVLGGGEVGARGRGGADGEARGLAQFQVEALPRLRVAAHALAVRLPVLAVLTCAHPHSHSSHLARG
jgi:hypothetical protein